MPYYFLFSDSPPAAAFRGSENNGLLAKVLVSVACWLMLTFAGYAQTCTVPSGSATISTNCSNVTPISGSQYNNGSLEITSTGSVGVSADAGNYPVAQAINISFGSGFAAYSFSNYGSIATYPLTPTGAPVNPVNIVGPGTSSSNTLSNFTNSGKIIATSNKGGDGFTLVNLENLSVNSFTNGTNGLISASWGGSKLTNGQVVGINIQSSSITNFANSGKIEVLGTSLLKPQDFASLVIDGSTISSFQNTGTIFGPIYLNNNSTITNLTNQGSISSPGTFIGSGSIIGTINNTGSMGGLTNNGVINTLNNLQGTSGSGTSPLLIGNNLPQNYNMIISGADYGQLSASNSYTLAGMVQFGVNFNNASDPQVGTYSSVLVGIAPSFITGFGNANYSTGGASGYTYQWGLLQGAPNQDGATTVDLRLLPSINPSQPYWLASSVGTFSNPNAAAFPFFQGGTLRLNEQNTYTIDFAVNSSSANTIDQYGITSIFSGFFSNAPSQTGNLTIANSAAGGQGRVIFTGNNTYTGTTTINSGAKLQIGNGGTTGSVAGNIVNNGALVFDRSDPFTYASVISGAGSLTMLGDGVLTLSGMNTYSGPTTVSNGTLTAGAANAFSSGSATTVNTGASLNLGGSPQSINTLSLAGGTVTNGSLTGTITSTGGVLDNISGTASLINALGTTLLTGNNNYTGTTTVNNGTVTANNDNAFASGSAYTVASGAILDLGNFKQTFGSLAGAGLVKLGIATLTTGGNNSSTVFTGPMTGTGGLTKVGTGTMTVGTLAFTGPTNINAGMLAVTSGSSIASDVNVANAATFNNAGTTNGIVTNSCSGTINNSGVMANNVDNSGSLTNTGRINGKLSNNSNCGTVNNTTGTIAVAVSNIGTLANAAGGTISGALTNNSGGVATNAGQITNAVSNSGTFTNTGVVNNIIVNDGTLNLDGVRGRVTGEISGNGVINVNGFFRQEAAISNSKINVNSGASLFTRSDVTSPAVSVGDRGLLAVDGQQNITGNLNNSGNVFPLKADDRLTVTGTYTQLASGRFITSIVSTNRFGTLVSGEPLNIADGSKIFALLDPRLRLVPGAVFAGVLQGAPLGSQEVRTQEAEGRGQISVQTNSRRYKLKAVWNGPNVDLAYGSIYYGTLTDQTLNSISAIQGPTLNALHQRYAVLNAVMVYDCNQFDKHNFCISANARATGFGTQATGSGVFNIAYRPTDQSRIGAYIDYQAAAGSPSPSTPSIAGTVNSGGVNYGYDNATFGGYLGFSESGYSGRMINTGAQAFLSGGFNPGKIDTHRALILDPYEFDFVDSQPGSGTASLSAYYARGMFGYGYGLTEKATLMPYLGVRYTNVTRGGYMERYNTVVAQPLVFNPYYERLVTGYGGMILNGQLTDQFGVLVSLGAELDILRAASNYSGYSPLAIQDSPFAFGFQHGGSWNGFRPTGNIGAYYDVMPNHRVSLNGYAGQQAFTTRTFTSSMLGYQISF